MSRETTSDGGSVPETDVPPSEFWLTRTVDRARSRVGSPFLAATATFGAPPIGVLLLYVVVRRRAVPTEFVFSLLSLAVVLLVGPYLIWYYDSRLLPQFLDEFSEIVRDEERLFEAGVRHRRLLSDRWWVAAVLAALPLPPLLVLGRPFLRPRGLYGFDDPVFLAVAAVLFWTSVLVGVGFLVVLITVLTVRSAVEDGIDIDPLHPDGLGGVSTVGVLSIRTTVLFSIGALLVPMQLQYAATVGPFASALIYLMATVYAVFIAASFLYPTVVVYRRGDEVRTDVLDDLRAQYREVKRRASEPEVGADTETTDAAAEQKLRRIRSEYEDFRTVSLYPFELSIIVRLVASVLLPLVFIVIDTLLRPEVVRRLLAAVVG